MTEGVAWLHYWKTLTSEPGNGEHKPPKKPLIVFDSTYPCLTSTESLSAWLSIPHFRCMKKLPTKFKRMAWNALSWGTEQKNPGRSSYMWEVDMKVILCCFQPRESWGPATFQTHRFLRLSFDEQMFSLNNILQINGSQKIPLTKSLIKFPS